MYLDITVETYSGWKQRLYIQTVTFEPSSTTYEDHITCFCFLICKMGIKIIYISHSYDNSMNIYI